MKLYGLCLILLATRLAGTSSQTFANDPTIGNNGAKFQEPESTMENKIHADETKLKEEQNGLELFEKFVQDLLDQKDESLQGSNVEEGRTFGVKRLQFMLMPMMYKMGVMMTLLVVLTVISLKTFGVGVLLLVLKLATIFGKFFAQSHVPISHGWPSQAQPVHLHVHNGNHHHPVDNGWESPSAYPESDQYYYKG